MYRRTERAAQIRAAAKALWGRREELFIVDAIGFRRMKLRGKLGGRRRTYSRYLRYMRDTNTLVAKAIAERNNRDATYADYAAAIAGQRAA